MERFLICETKFDGKLDIPVSSVNVESHVCSDRCFRSLKRFDKLQEDAKTRYRTLKEILWGIIEWSVGCLWTRQFLQVLLLKQNLFTTEKIKEGLSSQKVCHVHGEILPKPNPGDVVHNLALSSYKFSGLFAILFYFQWSRHLSQEILESELGLT